jgi:hypothetical protein
MFYQLTKTLAIAGLTVLLLAIVDDLMRHVLRHIFFGEVINSWFVFIRVVIGLLSAMTIFVFWKEKEILSLYGILVLLSIWLRDVLANGVFIHGAQEYTYSGAILGLALLHVAVMSWRGLSTSCNNSRGES